MTQSTIHLRLNADLHGYKTGHMLRLPVDSDGEVLDRYWAARIRDAELDGCVTILALEERHTVTQTPQSTSKKRKSS